MLEGVKTWYEGVKAQRVMKRALARLTTRKAELVTALIEDRQKLQESWGRMGTDYEMGWNQGINSQLRGGGDEKTAVSLSMIVDKMIPESRRMFVHNPFAKSAVINLQNFCIGGDGYQYRKTGKNEDKVSEYWLEWMKRVGWRDIEMEVLKRAIRDGVVILRWFGDVPRFIEAKQLVGTVDAPWGIETDPRDQVVVKAYLVAYTNAQTGLIDTTKVERVPAEQIDFLKWPLVDLNCLMPMPPLYFVAANLEGAARCLKNMRELVAVQTAIAIVREHIEGVSGSNIASWAQADADNELNDPDTDKTVFQKKWASGLVVEVPHGEKLHFPAATMRADSYIEVVQADLRAVAASLGLPEFIFTANASSSNYASLMAAEGPAVKAFETLQGWLGRFYEKAFDRVIYIGVKGGSRIMVATTALPAFPRLPARVLALLNSINPPTVRTRDFFAEARTRHIEAMDGVLSPQEWCASQGRDYEETMSNIEEHAKGHPDIPWPPTLAAQQAIQTSTGNLDASDDPDKPDPKTQTGSQKRNAGDSGA
jgi:hypothetical protein